MLLFIVVIIDIIFSLLLLTSIVNTLTSNFYCYFITDRQVCDNAAFHSTNELVITRGKLQLGSCNSSSPLCD